MNSVYTLLFFTIKEQFNLWKSKNRFPFILQTLFLITAAFLISLIIKPVALISPNLALLIILFQSVILAWLQTLLSIGNKLFSLNKTTFPSLLGVNKYINILSLALFHTYKNSIIGLSISIIYANSYVQIPLYFIVFLISTALSFQLAMYFLLLWVRITKSLNLLIIISFFSQFILIGGIIYLISTDYQLENIDVLTPILISFFILYFLIAFVPPLINSISPKQFNILYRLSVNSYYDLNRAKNSQKQRFRFTDSFRNPVIYKDTILVLSNPITKVRLYLWGLIQVVIIYFIVEKETTFFTNFLPYSSEQPEWFVLQSSLIISYLIFGEVVLSLFQMDKGILQWYSFARFKSHTLLRSKMILGFILLMIPNTISILIYSFLTELELKTIFGTLLLSFTCLLIIVMITLGISSLEVHPKTFSKPLEHLVISQQIPQTTITFVSLFSGFFFLIIFYLSLNRDASLQKIDLMIVFSSLIFSLLFYVVCYKKHEKRLLAYQKR